MTLFLHPFMPLVPKLYLNRLGALLTAACALFSLWDSTTGAVLRHLFLSAGVVYKRDRPKLTDDAVPTIFDFPPEEPKPEKPKKDKPIKPAKPAKTYAAVWRMHVDEPIEPAKPAKTYAAVWRML
jgi:hypothetical protein